MPQQPVKMSTFSPQWKCLRRPLARWACKKPLGRKLYKIPGPAALEVFPSLGKRHATGHSQCHNHYPIQEHGQQSRLWKLQKHFPSFVTCILLHWIKTSISKPNLLEAWCCFKLDWKITNMVTAIRQTQKVINRIFNWLHSSFTSQLSHIVKSMKQVYILATALFIYFFMYFAVRDLDEVIYLKYQHDRSLWPPGFDC